VCCQNLQVYSIVESQWLKHLVMHQNSQSVFSNYKQMVQHSISSFVVKTIDQYVILTLDSYVTITIYFYLWIFKFRYDMFVLMINFINSLWVPCHVTMGLCETLICL
jgi:hypothetical protein